MPPPVLQGSKKPGINRVKNKGALFEQLESGWAYYAQLKTKQNRKQGNKTRHNDQSK